MHFGSPIGGGRVVGKTLYYLTLHIYKLSNHDHLNIDLGVINLDKQNKQVGAGWNTTLGRIDLYWYAMDRLSLCLSLSLSSSPPAP